MVVRPRLGSVSLADFGRIKKLQGSSLSGLAGRNSWAWN